jgi:hypothetical protein
MHVAQPGCPGVRDGREAEGSRRCTSNGSVVCMSARPQGPRPYGTGRSVAMELNPLLTTIATSIATARADAPASVRVPGYRRQDGSTGGLP